MLNYHHKKYRYNLDKSIESKQENAEKVAKKQIQNQIKKTKKLLERNEIIKKQRELEQKMEMRDTLNLIKEIRKRDLDEQKKVDTIKEREAKKI